MKKILVVFIFLLFPLATESFANSSQVTKTGFVVQNTNAATSANVAIEFYNPDGSTEHLLTLTIDPHSSSLIDLDDLAELIPGWSGSAIITSDTPVVGAGWAETFSKYGRPEGIGWYNLPSSNDAGSSVHVPLVRRDPATVFGFNLWIQNTGSSTATVTVTYYAHAGGSSYNSSCVLVPGTSLDSINACLSNLPESFVGSAVVNSDQPVVVVANQSNPAKMTECLYNGIPGIDGDVELFFPIVQNNYQGWYSSFTVQNMSPSIVQGEFDYHSDCNTCSWENPLPSPPINSGYGYMFTPVTNSFSGYGKFTSVEPFGSVARVWNDSANTDYCYNGFGGGTTYPVSEERIWYIPSVNGNSRIVVKNTNEITGGNIKVSWLGLSDQQTVELLVNDKQMITPAVPDGWSGSGIVQSTDGPLPLAIVVQNAQFGGYDRGAYNAYGDNKGATNLYVPQVRKAQPIQPTIWKFYNPAILKGTKGEE